MGVLFQILISLLSYPSSFLVSSLSSTPYPLSIVSLRYVSTSFISSSNSELYFTIHSVGALYALSCSLESGIRSPYKSQKNNWTDAESMANFNSKIRKATYLKIGAGEFSDFSWTTAIDRKGYSSAAVNTCPSSNFMTLSTPRRIARCLRREASFFSICESVKLCSRTGRTAVSEKLSTSTCSTSSWYVVTIISPPVLPLLLPLLLFLEPSRSSDSTLHIFDIFPIIPSR